MLSLNVYCSSYEHNISTFSWPWSSQGCDSNIRNKLLKLQIFFHFPHYKVMLTPKSAWLLSKSSANTFAAHFDSQVPTINNSLVFEIQSIDIKNVAAIWIKYFLSVNDNIFHRQQPLHCRPLVIQAIENFLFMIYWCIFYGNEGLIQQGLPKRINSLCLPAGSRLERYVRLCLPLLWWSNVYSHWKLKTACRFTRIDN